MDLAHESSSTILPVGVILSFNPCFNGSCSRIEKIHGETPDHWSFNPCFNGSCSRIIIQEPHKPLAPVVSILVLMDLAHE